MASSVPPVKRVVMFKHGVAYLERRGAAEGDFRLLFKRDEINDVLKSLAVWSARGEGRVGAISFDAPEDPEAALRRRKLLFEEGHGLEGLLRAVRGRRVAVDDGRNRIEGEVVGLEEFPGGDLPPKKLLLLREAGGRIGMVELNGAKGLELLEEPSQGALNYLVDHSRTATAGETREVHVALSGRSEDLRVAYVVPAPVWRVSYRLVRDAGETLLMATGIVHNPGEEPLEDVELTLTTGQPVSFVIDLYQPMFVPRPVVKEQARVVAAPTQFERSMPPPPPRSAPAPMRARSMSAPAAYPADEVADGASLEAELSMGEAFGGGPQGATTGDRGEFFEYRVTTPVSLKPGGSAMVPLAAAKIDARKERSWRDGSGPNPDLVLHFENSTGIVLEEGPGVFYDEGSYSGESMVPYTARGSEVKLAFAKDLGVRCRRQTTSRQVVAGLALLPNYVVEEVRHEQHSVLEADSDHGEPIELIFEMPKVHGRSIDDAHDVPFEETANFYRFKVTVGPHAKAVLNPVERWVQQRYVQYNQLSGQQLSSWFENRFLDGKTREALSEVLALWAEAAKLDEQRARLERERLELFTKQEKLSQQLGVLKDGGAEGALRLRYVKELEQSQDRVNAHEQEIGRLQDSAEMARASAHRKIAELAKGASRRG